jgi:hypothetical protein
MSHSDYLIAVNILRQARAQKYALLVDKARTYIFEIIWHPLEGAVNKSAALPSWLTAKTPLAIL